MKAIVTEEPARVVERSSTFLATDGIPLFYRHWEPSTDSTRCVILMHRGHEHSGRLDETAREFCARGATCFAYDVRGHGHSPGRRGDAPGFATLVRDLDAFARHIHREHGFSAEEMVIVANSVAGVVAATWVHDYAPHIRGLVLVAPAFSIKLYVPFALPALRVLLRLKPDLFIKSYVRPSFLTHDRIEARRYAKDSLISRDISARVLVELNDTARRLIADAGAIETPTLLLSSGSDCVVRERHQRAFHKRLGSGLKRFVRKDGMRHALLHERDRAEVVAAIGNFIDEVFSTPPANPGALLAADRTGETAREFEQLQKPPALTRRAWFGLQRLVLKTAGRLSHGIRIGWRDGFDSGSSLDCIYENTPRGCGWIGRLIDRAYLNAPGWRGIRQRRALMEDTLRTSLREANGDPVHVVDIATGHGRYVLEVLRDFPNASAYLSDWSDAHVLAARIGAEDRRLSRVVCEQGDAFDETRLAALTPKADIVIVSGLYELFPENARVLESLRGVSRLLKPGGRLIYTNQPTHPQLEMIARVLRNREGKPWIMRRRSQLEMDALVQSVSLRKERTTIDDQGIFSVSIAQKEAA
jgi:alpha-beta hydrolase superfamily lysophospholipase/ubiquinone/menaquinone biosynthesis C-methylase UbiE